MEKKKLLIDARMVKSVPHGISAFVEDIALALHGRDLPFALHFLRSPQCPGDSPLRQFPGTESSIPFLHPLEFWRLAKEIQADLFYSPSFMSLKSYPCPHLQTVHDLNHLRFGHPMQKLYYKFLLKPSLEKAKAVSTVCESTAQEIRGWWPGKLWITTNSLHDLPRADESLFARLGLPKGYFFCLSNPKPHKNTAMLEYAFGLARAQGCEKTLVTNVPGPFQEGIRRIETPTSAEVAALFAGAHSYFFPSLYEGFGRSPLEAVLMGTAPVASNIPPHREVLEGVKEAVLLDPEKPELWRDEFLRREKLEKQSVSSASQAWVRETYSLEKMAQQLLAFFSAGLS